MNTTSDELRELAIKIMQCVEHSAVSSIAYPIVSNAADHLCAIARVHEANNGQKMMPPT
jgi:hypothetical protein